MEQILFRLPQDLKRELKVQAALKGCSITQMLNEIIELYLKKNTGEVA